MAQKIGPRELELRAMREAHLAAVERAAKAEAKAKPKPKSGKPRPPPDDAETGDRD